MAKKIIVRHIFIIIFLIIFFYGNECHEAKAENNNVNIDTPRNVRVYRHSNTSLKLKWRTVKKADGYIIYRYSKKNSKYIAVKNIRNTKTTEWIDKQRETDKVYKYKIAAYKKINQKKYFSKKSDYVMVKTYQRDKVKINAREPKVSNRKVYLGLCSAKKIKTRVLASKYGTNRNKKAFHTKVRWYSSNNIVAKVDKNGKITAGTAPGECNIYAAAHNGRRTKIKVVVKNYARAKRYYNCWEEEDLNTLVYEHTDVIQDIAEYFSVNRLKENETISIYLNNVAEVVVEPERKFSEKISREIEDLLVNFPYYIGINVDVDCIDFVSKKEDTNEARPGHVIFWFDNDCSQWSGQIASHWQAVRFYPI
ncbi:MAG: hypothetical protein HFG29_03875 [Eubacterium sp.]|nr:hypothetical protein [Eubacterium sp.]